MTTVDYDGYNNPPGTVLSLVQVFDSGLTRPWPLPDLRGSISIPLGTGHSTLVLQATRELNQKTFESVPLEFHIRGIQTEDLRTFSFEAESRPVGNEQRWYAGINLRSVFISNKLRVSSIGIHGSYAGGWILRNQEVGDTYFAGPSSVRSFPGLPMFNNDWRITSQAAVGPESAPVIQIHFTLSC